MPNITLSVSSEMKARMDNFSEVSWSNVCRNAILSYLEEREKDTRITDSNNLKVIAYIDPVGRRRRDNNFIYMLKIKNNEPFDVILDRVIYGVQYQYTVDEKNVEKNENPLLHLQMNNVGSNEVRLISSHDGLESEFKKTLFELYDNETEIKWTMFGEIYYRSKTEIFRTGFHIQGILSDNLKHFNHDHMAM